jgi:hypothetical protein
MMDAKLRMCLVSFELSSLNLGYYIYVVTALVTLYMLWDTLLMIIKIIALIGTWRTT